MDIETGPEISSPHVALRAEEKAQEKNDRKGGMKV